MNSQLCGQSSGCGGIFCISCRTALQRMTLRRYPADANGEPCYEAQPQEGWVCALVYRSKGSASSKLAIAGQSGGQSSLCMTVAAGSLEKCIAAGDILTDDSGREYLVLSVGGGELSSARIAERT